MCFVVALRTPLDVLVEWRLAGRQLVSVVRCSSIGILGFVLRLKPQQVLKMMPPLLRADDTNMSEVHAVNRHCVV